MAAYDGLFRDRVCVITGGAGFIGSHLAHALVERGARVRVIDNLSGGKRENVARGVEFVEASILEAGALKRVMAGAEHVFHQAAMVSVPESVAKPEECVAVNIGGTERVLAAAREAGARRVNFAASAAAYGNTPSLPSKETDLPDSWSPYAASKVAGELLLRTYSRCYGLSTVSLRYFNVFGPRQDPKSPYAAVISAFAAALTEGRRPRVMGDGLQTRDFCYIDNVVHANLLAATAERGLEGEVINVGTGARITLLDVLRHMGEVLKVELPPEFGPPRAGDVRHSSADIRRARELLGYEPLVEFGEGIRRTLEWFRG